MQIVRYRHQGAIGYGALAQDRIVPLDGAFPDLRQSSAAPLPLATVELLAPVLPSKIVAVGPNYRAHLVGRPVPERPFLWLKPGTAVIASDAAIILPASVPPDRHINHEAELGIVIGRVTRNVAVQDAGLHIFGYCCLNDVTVGDLTDRAAFRASSDFVDGKIFDTFAPMGAVVAIGVDPSNLHIECRVNGEIRQNHSTSDMIWSCAELVSRISHIMTLLPGDVVATGTPPGSAPMHGGDLVEITIEGIGTLRNPVRDERQAVAA